MSMMVRARRKAKKKKKAESLLSIEVTEGEEMTREAGDNRRYSHKGHNFGG